VSVSLSVSPKQSPHKQPNAVEAIQSEERPQYDWNFSPYRRAATSKSQNLIMDVLKFLSSLEDHDTKHNMAAARQRKRKAADQERYERQVEALVCDAACHHIGLPGRWLRVSRSNRVLGVASNYKPSFMTEKATDVMDALSRREMGFLEMELGGRTIRAATTFEEDDIVLPGRQSRIRAGERLVGWIGDRGIEASDFGLDPEGEVIYLKGKKGSRHNDKAELINYDDTDETRRMRADLRRINAWIEQADVEVGIDYDHVDESRRRLRRVFTDGSWESHGRFFGGFWIDMKSEERKDIFIDGELCADLDFGQMNTRLLYAEVGATPHFEDAYIVPGLEEHREGVKTLLNAVIAADRPLSRFPKGVRKLIQLVRDPDGGRTKSRFNEVFQRVSDFHAPVAHMFYKGLATRLMFRESEIMNSVLLRLIEEGVTALPVHDGLLVAQSKAERARDVMLECFRAQTGLDGVVTITT
jgi:hypothetical protein